MAYQVRWDRLAFQKTKVNDPKIPDGPEEVVPRGGLVPDYVGLNIVSALANSGMIVYVDDPDPALAPASELPEQPRLPEQPAFLPSNPNSTPEVLGGDVPPDDGAGDELPPLPATGDNKATWEEFAQRPFIGMTAGGAEAMNKTDLMAEVRTRYAAAEESTGL